MQPMRGQNAGDDGPRNLRDETWETLVDAITAKQVTPFLGAGIAVPYLPRGGQLAEQLATRHGYPLDDVTNLARVTQFIASKHGESSFARRRVVECIKAAQARADAALTQALPENHRILAALRLPMYITTNYDDYLERALRAGRDCTPVVEICRWNDLLRDVLGDYSTLPPTTETPWVFHLHGHMSEPDSVLVTEDDYIDFTVSLAVRLESDPILHHRVVRAFANTNLLFLGYSLEDWNFRVLLRQVMKQYSAPNLRSRLSIQLSDQQLPPERRARAEDFLERYLRTSSSIDVYWGDAGDFLRDLQSRVDQALAPQQAS
jgi:hypothetical protein